jgi:3-dehydroquinate dehydratase-2
MTSRVLVLNGPNLNLLGERDPAIYGSATLSDIESTCIEAAHRVDLSATCVQSNHEGELISAIHDARHDTVGIVANLGAYTHTSIAIMDALAIYSAPVVEVHLSNVHAREQFRRHSYISQVASAVIAGAGPHGYALAIQHVAALNEAAQQQAGTRG